MNENTNGNNKRNSRIGLSDASLTRYKVAEMIICILAVAVGVGYFVLDWLGLGVLLPAYSAACVAVAFLRVADARTKGARGAAAYAHAIGASVLALAVVAATVAYFAQ